MDRRLELQQILEEILGSDEVHFQPPASVRMNYPAIVYAREKIDSDYADNVVYRQDRRYRVTVIDPDPDSEIVTAVSLLPMCKHDRHFVSDNLNHDVFTISY